jgi:hypothetical protein
MTKEKEIEELKKDIKDFNHCLGCHKLLKGVRGRNSKSGMCYNCISELKNSYNRLNVRKVFIKIKEAEIKGFLAGQNSQKEKDLKIIEEHIGCTDGDCLEIIKQKIKGDKS